VKRAQKALKTKDRQCKKRARVQNFFDNNGDKQEIAMNPGLAHGTGAKMPWRFEK
jgi:hypothetical protein